MPRQPATVTIDIETCKGCILCVEVCPPRVLLMSEDTNRMGYRYPLLLDGCTGCELCYKICPDYCFEVYRGPARSEEHTSELQSPCNLVCRLLLEKKKAYALL